MCTAAAGIALASTANLSLPALLAHMAQVAESKALQRDTIQAQRELHAGQLRQLERLVEQVRAVVFERAAG